MATSSESAPSPTDARKIEPAQVPPAGTASPPGAAGPTAAVAVPDPAVTEPPEALAPVVPGKEIESGLTRPGGRATDTGSAPDETPSGREPRSPTTPEPSAKASPVALPGGLRPMGTGRVDAGSATLRMTAPGSHTPTSGPRAPAPGTPTPDLGRGPDSAPHTPVPGPRSSDPASHTPVPDPRSPGSAPHTPVPGPQTPASAPHIPVAGTRLPGVQMAHGPGGGLPRTDYYGDHADRAGSPAAAAGPGRPQAHGQARRPAVDISRERPGITPLTWAFLLLTIAAILLGVIVVRNALMSTQPGVDGSNTGMRRAGEVEQTPAPIVLVTDLTSSGKTPSASGRGHLMPVALRTAATALRWFDDGSPPPREYVRGRPRMTPGRVERDIGNRSIVPRSPARHDERNLDTTGNHHR